MNLRKSLLDAAQQFFVPVNFQIRKQPALHQHARAAEFDRLANLVVNSFEIEDVAFFGSWSLQWPIERAERAIFSAEVCVIDIAINDVSDHALWMQLASDGVSFHTDTDQVIGAKQVESLLFGKRHLRPCLILSKAKPESNLCGFRARRGGGLMWLFVPQIFNKCQNCAQHCQTN